jgi:hypothetical protein
MRDPLQTRRRILLLLGRRRRGVVSNGRAKQCGNYNHNFVMADTPNLIRKPSPSVQAIRAEWH